MKIVEILMKVAEFYFKSFKIYLNLFGENNSDVATLLDNNARLLQNFGILEKAEMFYLKSLKIRQNLFGENHFMWQCL